MIQKMREWFNDDKRIFYIILFLIIVSTIFDMYTAFTSPVFSIAETNPIYLTFGKNALIAITIGITFWILNSLKKKLGLYTIFLITLASIYLIVGHILGGASNLMATKQYHTNSTQFIEEHKSLTKSDKIKEYNFFAIGVLLVPILLSYFAFVITYKFYNLRKDKREKVMDEIAGLIIKLR